MTAEPQTEAGKEMLLDPQDHWLSCAYSRDYLHEAPCDCGRRKQIIAIETEARSLTHTETEGLLREAQDEIGVAMGNIIGIPMSDPHREMVREHLLTAYSKLEAALTATPPDSDAQVVVLAAQGHNENCPQMWVGYGRASGMVAVLREALELIQRCIRNSSQAPNVLDTIAWAATKALSDTEATAKAHDAEVVKPWREALNDAARDAHAYGLISDHGKGNDTEPASFDYCEYVTCREARALLSNTESAPPERRGSWAQRDGSYSE